MEEITQLISNVGFPIMACIFMYKQQQELIKTITGILTTLQSMDSRLNNLEGEKRYVA